jgi:hypothetical protein
MGVKFSFERLFLELEELFELVGELEEEIVSIQLLLDV